MFYVHSKKLCFHLVRTFQVFKYSGYQDFRISGFQDFRIPGFQDFRVSGFQDFRSSAMMMVTTVRNGGGAARECGKFITGSLLSCANDGRMLHARSYTGVW